MSSSRTIRWAGAALCAALSCAAAPADTLKITSTPPEATVEIDGQVVGKTPFEKEYPGGYFRRTRTAMGARLEHPLTARISLQGYATKEIPLTDGPMEWISLNGRRRGQYWLFKAKESSGVVDTLDEFCRRKSPAQWRCPGGSSTTLEYETKWDGSKHSEAKILVANIQ